MNMDNVIMYQVMFDWHFENVYISFKSYQIMGFCELILLIMFLLLMGCRKPMLLECHIFGVQCLMGLWV